MSLARNVAPSIDSVLGTAERRGVIVTLAPWQLWNACESVEYEFLVRRADMTTIDGRWLQSILRLAGLRYPLVTGRALLQSAVSNESQKRVAVIGGSTDAVQKMREMRPDWLVLGQEISSPPTNPEVNIVANGLRSFQPDFVFLALGSPKQEQLAFRLNSEFPSTYLGVGGAVEVVSGVKAAPRAGWSLLKLEWLQRLLLDPSRFMPRILQASSIMPSLMIEALYLRTRRTRSLQ